MRILLVVPWDEAIGGVMYVASNLARHLKARGHTVMFLNPGRSVVLKPKVTKCGFPGFALRMQLPFTEWHPVISTLAFMILFPITMYQLIRLIQKRQIQIINIHYPAEYCFYFAVCCRLLRVILVTSIHGADLFPDGKPRVRYSPAINFLLSSSDLIVAPSRTFRMEFLSVFTKFMEKTIFIHNGINLAELEDFRAPVSENNRGSYILCISSYTEQKAIDVLVRAFQLVRKTNPTVKLVIVGGGPLRDQMAGLAVSLEVGDQIEFLGPQERVEVAKLLHACHVFVLPSRFETFGIALLEAMACKKAVIATTAGGIPEIIESGKNGVLVEPDNPTALARALVAVLENERLQCVLAANAYTTVRERFCFERTGVSYESAFSRLLTLLP